MQDLSQAGRNPQIIMAIRIVHNVTMKDLSVLQEPPFTVQGSIVEVFTDLTVLLGIRRAIEQVNANAAA